MHTNIYVFIGFRIPKTRSKINIYMYIYIYISIYMYANIYIYICVYAYRFPNASNTLQNNTARLKLLFYFIFHFIRICIRLGIQNGWSTLRGNNAPRKQRS